jgi:hypothetical protein
LVFEKSANIFAENCQKSQKIVIITSTPGHRVPILQIVETSFWQFEVLSLADSLPQALGARRRHEDIWDVLG